MSSLERLGPGGTPSVVRTIEAEGIDRKTLLVNWLNEILYLEQTRGEVYDRFQILESSNRHLHARLDGRQSGGWGTHIKAAHTTSAREDEFVDKRQVAEPLDVVRHPRMA